MHEDTSTSDPARPGTSLLGAVIAAAGAIAMGTAIPTLHDLAEASYGLETLIGWLLLGLAGSGTLLCLYLTLIWGLATAIMLAGPASRTGAALLGLLRVLAPRLARRLAGGAAAMTAVTALTLAPSLAAQDSLLAEPSQASGQVSHSAELHPAEAPPTDPAPEAAAPGSSPEQGSRTGAPLPTLGWGEASGPGTAETGSDASPPHGTGSPGSGSEGSDSSAQRTVVVERGDSLWSISDDLLGPGPSDPEVIAAAWPLLHEANRDLLGADPDRLHPGQELIVPSAMTPQDIP